MEPLRGDGVRGLTVAVVRVAVEIIPNDGDFGSWLMPREENGKVFIINTAFNFYIQTYILQKICKCFLGHRDRQGRVWWCYLFVTAGADGDWWCEGQRGRGALVVWVGVRGERLGGQVTLPILKELQSGCVSA